MTKTRQELLEAAQINFPVLADMSSVYTGDCHTPSGRYDMIASTKTAWGDGMPERNEARAEMIALALNNYEALLEALEKIEQLLSNHPEVTTGNSKVHYVYHLARTTLNPR